VFFDIQKVFDSVWYMGLIKKLIDGGVPDVYLKQIKLFLQERTYRVKYEFKLSKWHLMKAGVPQRSVQAPKLYNIYISDIPNSHIIKEHGMQMTQQSTPPTKTLTQTQENFKQTLTISPLGSPNGGSN
jgi:Reverse transcriptase (RNA-dependent DNA polymerase).